MGKRFTSGQSLWWVEDAEGNLITYGVEPGSGHDELGDAFGDGTEEPCTLYAGQLDYLEVESRNQVLGCSVHFSATYQINPQNINLRLSLSDHSLIFEYRCSFSEQIDTEINGSQALSGLDL